MKCSVSHNRKKLNQTGNNPGYCLKRKHSKHSRTFILKVEKIILPQSDCIFYSQIALVSFLSQLRKSSFTAKHKLTLHFVITVTFCGALLFTGDSNLSLIPKYCVSSFHFSSFSNCWLLKTNKQTSDYHNHFPFHNL